jgi:ATP-dependent Lon protease
VAAQFSARRIIGAGAKPLGLVELALEEGASEVLVPVPARRQLLELSDDAADRMQVVYYFDAEDGLRIVIAGLFP